MSDGEAVGSAGGGEASGGVADLTGGAAAAGDEGGGGAAGGTGEGGAEGTSGDVSGGADPEWYGQLSADREGEEPSLRDWAKASGVKDINGLAKIARDNVKALRDSGRVKVPAEGAPPEEVAAFRKAIGVPDDTKGYAVEPPKGEDGEPLKGDDGKPLQMNQPLLDRLAAKAHEAGMPAGAYKAVVAEFVKAQLEEAGARNQELNRDAAKWVKDQGKDADEKQAAADNAIRALGLTRKETMGLRATWGAGRTMDVLAKLGAGISEDTLMRGSGNLRFGQSASEAKAQLTQRQTSKDWVAAAMKKGTPENAEYTRLTDAIGAAADREAREAQGA